MKSVKYFKFLVFIAIIAVTVLSFTACTSKKETSQNTKKIIVKPEKVVEDTLNNLKNGSYDDLEIFAKQKLGNSDKKELYAAIFENLQYTIVSTTKNDDKSVTVRVDISNLELEDMPSIKDFKTIDELDGQLVKEVQDEIAKRISATTKTFNTQIDVELVMGDENYQIINKMDLYSAASGNYIGTYIEKDDENQDNSTEENITKAVQTQGPQGGPAGGPSSKLDGESNAISTSESSKNSNSDEE